MSRYGSEGEDIIGRWSEDKLDLLAKYLKAYSTIMNNQKTSNNPTGKAWLEEYHYIDAFAGSVRPQAKEDEQRYINGSPLRALETEPQFDRYWFIDISPRRIEQIEKLRTQFPERLITTRQGDCNQILCDEIISQIPRGSHKRAFVFLDPYGLQVTWETVKSLANTRTCDIFVNFSVMGVTRLLPREQPPDSHAREQLNKVIGNTEWIMQVYQEPTERQLSLFSDSEMPTPSRDTLPAQRLADLYAEQLKSLFKFVSNPLLMKNSTNSTLYALYLASHNQNAVKITNEIFGKYTREKPTER